MIESDSTRLSFSFENFKPLCLLHNGGDYLMHIQTTHWNYHLPLMDARDFTPLQYWVFNQKQLKKQYNHDCSIFVQNHSISKWNFIRWWMNKVHNKRKVWTTKNGPHHIKNHDLLENNLSLLVWSQSNNKWCSLWMWILGPLRHK